MHLFQVALAHDSGLPEDVTVNTFHCGAATMNQTEQDDWAQLLDDFYNDVFTGNNVMGFLSSQISGDYTIKVYDLTDPEPRAPTSTYTGAWGGIGITAMPSEVSCCLSYQAAAISGVPQARRRGRLFIGPLAQTAQSGTTVPRPATGLIATLCETADSFRVAAVALGLPWVVHSRVLGTGANVTNGWVDNAFDTQRRRGEAATARTLWP